MSQIKQTRQSLKGMTDEEKKQRKKEQMREYMNNRRKEDPEFAKKQRELCANRMKVLRENKIRRDRLTFFGYVSAEEFENDIMIGKITLAKFIGIVGNNVIEKYQAILYYIK